MDHPASAPLDVVWNPTDADWASAVGRFMLNMGTIETVTRVLIAQIHGTDHGLGPFRTISPANEASV